MSAIGVLALQGGFDAHRASLCELGHTVRLVRTIDDLDAVAGLVLPGGESTTQWKLLASGGLLEPMRSFARAGRPILATCAGLILASRRAYASREDAARQCRQESLELLDVDVIRNGYGRQLDSFEGRDDADEHELVFIRAPRIERVGPDVQILARCGGEPVLVRQGSIVAGAFHPELTRDRSIHALAFGRSITRFSARSRQEESTPVAE